LALPTNDRSEPVFSSLVYWSKKVPLALEGLSVAMSTSSCIRELHYWILYYYGNALQLVSCSGEGSIEGNSERDLLMGKGDLMIRRYNYWKA
jgi:hypothetical protein